MWVYYHNFGPRLASIGCNNRCYKCTYILKCIQLTPDIEARHLNDRNFRDRELLKSDGYDFVYTGRNIASLPDTPTNLR
jgi:hypothetical protein